MTELNIGTIIQERYKLLQHIGSGSFGDVWLAEDTILNINIAIKFYVALDERGQKEFIDEYKNSFSLSHSNILTAKHYAIWEKRPYLIMEYCPEGSANKLCNNTDEHTIWKFIHDVAAGLNYLHKNDIIHQDIKPDNVLINPNGDFVITDFGISHKVRSTMRKQSGRIENSGSIAYMGPERFQKDVMLINASDIWSLGASIYELATGELPFNGLGGGMMLSGAEIPDLPEKFSADLNKIMQLCLSKEPWERPLAANLEKMATRKLNGESLEPSSPTQIINQNDNNNQSFEPVNETKKKSNLPKIIIGILVAVIIAGGAVGFSVYKSFQTKKSIIKDYRKVVTECKVSIEAGDIGNTNSLLDAKDQILEVKKLEDQYANEYEECNEYKNLKQALDQKCTEAANSWRDAAEKQYFNLHDVENAKEYYSLALQLSNERSEKLDKIKEFSSIGQ